KRINIPDRKIITIEDPVEYQMDGVNQIQVNPQIGLTFATGLRHIVRQDPDVIMIGEIRDLETAEIAIRSALTGHLVFSTLHTNDAPSAVPRLIVTNPDANVLRDTALKSRMRTLRDDGWTKVRAGLTTPDEVLRVTQEV